MNAPEKSFAAPVRTGMQALPLTLADLAAFDAMIDVRSPAEFAEDHVPGAINLPVLDNAERARVGTIYKQESAFAAKVVGAAIVARNIARHIDASLQGKPKGWKPLVYCWRGGSRSGAMAHILRSIGWPALQLTGGYKAWRSQVIQDLLVLPQQFPYQVICGRTGSGKSRLLDALAASGRQVLDLEKLAAHKGSVLGDLPDAPQPAQRMFESAIWTELSAFDPARPVYVEAESKKVGALRVPEALIERMRASPCHEVITPDVLRMQLLREEYAHLIADQPLLFGKLDCLADLHSREQVEHWKSLARDQQWDLFVGDMLCNHYDPAYGRSMFRNFVFAARANPLAVRSIDAAGFAELARQLPA
jgi:tRNA 2-selenouridine synthase